MAYKIMPVYNINKSVGQNGTNLVQDVLLIQTFLNELSKAKGGWAPAVPLLVNGLPSPVLVQWITAFQKSVKERGNPIAVDGRVDPMLVKDTSDWSAGFGNSWSTMYAMNRVLRRYAKSVHEGLADRLGLTEI